MEANANLSTHHPQGKESQYRREALTRAVSGQSLTNFPAIFQGFAAKGIPESEIKPRENVFTFDAWKALGRVVRRGEHGVKVVTFIDCRSKELDADTGERKVIRRPWTTTVFHVSQTEALRGGGL
jgi:hypothetical protein